MDKLNAAIRIAKTAAAAADKLDSELRFESEITRAEGQAETLAGQMADWVEAQRDLKNYFVEVAAAAEKANGTPGGSAISQGISLAAVAGEVRPHLRAGKSMAATAISTMTTQVGAMMPHRSKMYANIEDASYGVNKREDDGPVVGQIRGCIATAKEWEGKVMDHEMALNRAESAVGM